MIFFEQYIFPSIKEHIEVNQEVESIDYSSSEIRIKTKDTIFLADKVVVTVPVKMLQTEAITFLPDLPKSKQNAINKVRVWGGCKAFIEFSEKFYPTLIGFDIEPPEAGQKLYYDASYGQTTEQHILGLFAVGTGTIPYVDLPDDELIQYMLKELDQQFDGKASASYIKHTFQNWNKEPFARGAYIIDDEDWRLVRKLGESVADRVFFAGDAYTDGEDWGAVHNAAMSAKRAVEEIMES